MTSTNGHEDVEAGLEDGVEPAEPLDDERALLRHDDGRACDDDEDERKRG